MRPRLARIGRLVNTIADGKVRALQSFATADVDNVWIGDRNGNRTYGARRLIIKNWKPRAAVIGRLKNTTVHLCHVEDVRLRRDARNRPRAAAAMGTDVTPVQRSKQIRRNGLSANRYRPDKQERKNGDTKTQRPISETTTHENLLQL